MNKTLSLIEEDIDEENSQHHLMSLGGSQKIVIEDTLKDMSLQGSPLSGDDPQKYTSLTNKNNSSTVIQVPPSIVREIEQMEREFTEFLEQIYN